MELYNVKILKKPTAKQATVGITQTTSHKEYQNMNFDMVIITN